MVFVVKIDLKKCKGEGMCQQVCPVGTFNKPNGGKCTVNVDKVSEKSGDSDMSGGVVPDCIGCRACEVQCPASAITISEG